MDSQPAPYIEIDPGDPKEVIPSTLVGPNGEMFQVWDFGGFKLISPLNESRQLPKPENPRDWEKLVPPSTSDDPYDQHPSQQLDQDR